MSGNLKELTMPKWGLTMEEGTLVQWLIEEGTQIEPGMALAEVETDKIVNVMEAPHAGVLVKKVAVDGDVLPVGALLGVVASGAASEGEIDSFVANYDPAATAESEEAAKEENAAKAEDTAPKTDDTGIFSITMPKWGLTMEEGTLVQWLVEEGAKIEVGMALAEVETDKIVNVMEATNAGVLRKKTAGEGDVLPVGALLAVMAEPSITDAEIDAYIAGGGAVASEEEAPAAAPEKPKAEPAKEAAPAAEVLQPVASMRAAIAKTVSTSWTTIPHYMVTVVIDMEKAESLSSKLKEEGTKVSINDMLIKGAALALQKFPLLNASFADKNIVLHNDINIAMAIGLDEGVVMPVIKKCQELTVQQTGTKSRELVDLAKNGKLGKEELAGGTFAISNMGMLGVEDFIAIVPPGLSAILAVGMVKDEPVARNGKVVIGRMMRITISADHRVHDGAYAAKYLAELKNILEGPEAIVL
jgi:pyruvate dehydrogenase E2 component (dihydrolipoamide acetyltransferase)